MVILSKGWMSGRVRVLPQSQKVSCVELTSTFLSQSITCILGQLETLNKRVNGVFVSSGGLLTSPGCTPCLPPCVFELVQKV